MGAKKGPPEIKGRKRRFRRRRARQAGEPSAMDLVEEGVHLLRRTPISAWSVYLCGVTPFLLGFLFFWMEMATSGLAERTLIPGSLAMAGLFIWFKAAQSYFARGLREALLGHTEPRWRFGTWLRVMRRQAFWQSTGVILLPIAFVVTVPFAWLFAFYQNILISDPLNEEEDAELFQRNWKLARMWHEQNWMLLTLFGLVGFLTWLNWLSMVFFGPFLLKSLLGIETIFSRVGLNLINTTTLFACVLLAYVVTDPVIKAAYLLRRHYSESRKNGADLLLRLRRYKLKAKTLKVVSILVLMGAAFLSVTPAKSFAEVPAEESMGVNVEQLDASIEEVLERREFVWRFPREDIDAEKEGGLIQAWLDKIEAFEERIKKWLEDIFGVDRDRSSDRGFLENLDLGGLGSLLGYLLIGSFVLLVLLLAFRAYKIYEPEASLEGDTEEGAVPMPDLEDEDVSADLMPRNRWVELARKLIADGEYRLALRAYFLAQLSAFSSEGLIVIRKAKSNREYVHELSKRGHGKDRLLELFWEELCLFESIWYGERPSGPEEIAQMEAYLTEQGVLA